MTVRKINSGRATRGARAAIAPLITVGCPSTVEGTKPQNVTLVPF